MTSIIHLKCFWLTNGMGIAEKVHWFFVARKKNVFFLEKGIFPAFASHSGAGIISYSSPLSLRSKVAHNFPTK